MPSESSGMGQQNEIWTVDAAPRGVGESPVWDPDTGTLYYVSILDGDVHSIDIRTGAHHTIHVEAPLSALGLCRSGKLVVALRDSVILVDPATGERQTLCTVKHPIMPMRLNDGKVGPDGAFWIGSMDDRPNKEAVGSLYRVTADGDCSVICDGIHISNGLAWSPDGTIMYHSDSRGPWVDAWDFDPSTGHVTNRRRFLDLDEATGRPDGGACDLAGNYWSAGPSASRVNCFSPAGDLVASVVMPNYRPTMPCFGGPDMQTLYVTSLTQGLPADVLAAHPLAGTLLATRVAQSGVLVHRFAA